MTSPAQVSGPGALSQRTDAPGQPIRSLPDAQYGENKDFVATQKAAPLAEAVDPLAGGPRAPSPRLGAAPEPPPGPPVQLPGLYDDGAPDIPITTGAATGPGANQVSGLPPGVGGDFNPTSLRDALQPYAAADPSGILANTINQLSERGLW